MALKPPVTNGIAVSAMVSMYYVLFLETVRLDEIEAVIPLGVLMH